ncbi:hypothetical protein BDW22DRAFT_819892 [Trametopsis cervina]|nr:hypothetical protein BDW22DRAFT_819892 [Trametopsis cervina]
MALRHVLFRLLCRLIQVRRSIVPATEPLAAGLAYIYKYSLPLNQPRVEKQGGRARKGRTKHGEGWTSERSSRPRVNNGQIYILVAVTVWMNSEYLPCPGVRGTDRPALHSSTHQGTRSEFSLHWADHECRRNGK